MTAGPAAPSIAADGRGATRSPGAATDEAPLPLVAGATGLARQLAAGHRTTALAAIAAGTLTGSLAAVAGSLGGTPAMAAIALALAGAAVLGPRLAATRPAAPAAPAQDGPVTVPRARAADEAIAVTDGAGRLVHGNGAFGALCRRLGHEAPVSPFDLLTDPAVRRGLYLAARHALSQTADPPAAVVADVPAAGGGAPVSAAITLTRTAGDPGLLAFRITEDEARPARPGAPAGAIPDAARELVGAIVAACPGLVAAVDRDGRVLAATDALRALAGPAAPGATPLGLDALFAEGSDPTGLLAPLFSGERTRVDGEVPGAGGEGRLYRLAARALDGPGEAPLAIIALTDVTRQSALEARFAEGQKLQAIGQLAGGVAHDFNNVLTAIIGFSDLLLQSHRPSDPSFRDIMNIRQSAQRAAGLVRQLLAFSRRQTLRPSRLDVNDVIADLSVMLDRLLGERVALSIAYGRDLRRVMADLSQLEQVIINLAVNARDAMPAGGTVTIGTRNVTPEEALALDPDGPVAGEGVLIEVSDTGTGIAPEIIDRIFDPFFTTKEIGEGTGLGLSTVYGIVTQTGGSLAVRSTVGEGTTFSIVLPVVAAAPVPAEAEEPRREAPARRQDLTGSATVLLVEDEEAIRLLAARALTNKGYRVVTAANGLEALEVMERDGAGIDLLLTDVVMPELDGPALVERLAGRYPHLKVVFMSGYADAGQAGALDARAAAGFIHKPFTLKILAQTVKEALTT